jgi:hypothetical protein
LKPGSSQPLTETEAKSTFLPSVDFSQVFCHSDGKLTNSFPFAEWLLTLLGPVLLIAPLSHTAHSQGLQDGDQAFFHNTTVWLQQLSPMDALRTWTSPAS